MAPLQRLRELGSSFGANVLGGEHILQKRKATTADGAKLKAVWVVRSDVTLVSSITACKVPWNVFHRHGTGRGPEAPDQI